MLNISTGHIELGDKDWELYRQELLSQPGQISLWDAAQRKELQRLELPVRVLDFALSADRRLIATLGGDSQIRVWSVDDGSLKHTLQDQIEFGRQLAFSPDGHILALGSGSTQEIRLWSIADGSLFRTLTTENGVDDLAFSPDGVLLAARGGGEIMLWRVDDGVLLRTFETKQSSDVSDKALCFSPDGQILASAGRSLSAASAPSPARPFVPTIEPWRVADGQLLHQLSADHIVSDSQEHSRFFDVTFSADGSRLVAGLRFFSPRGAAAVIWRVQDGIVLQHIEDLPYSDSLCLTSNGTQVLLADSRAIYVQQLP